MLRWILVTSSRLPNGFLSFRCLWQMVLQKISKLVTPGFFLTFSGRPCRICSGRCRATSFLFCKRGSEIAEAISASVQAR